MKSRGGAALLVALAVMGVLAGCGDTTDTPSKAKESSSVAPHSSKVKLIDPGAEPREPIRLQLVAGTVQRSSLRMQTTMSMTIDGKAVPASDMPPMVMGMRVTVDEIRSNGNIKSSFAYDSMRVEGTGETAKKIEQGLKDSLLRVTGKLETTANGEFVDGDMDIPSDMDPTMRTMMKSIETQMENLTAPLPLEDVGIGAVWSVSSPVEVNGIKSTNVYEFKLVERSEHGLVLETTTTATAPEQDPELPGMPAGTSVHLERMSMAGSGRTTMDLALLLPASSTSSSAGEVKMTFDENGSTSTMLQKLKVRVAVTSLDR